ncbi:Phosphoribosyl transferase domain [Mycobacteroides abscessus subsp. abscessus]|nr:Phosphoribosyl transferase domain [Mycobacteroides abscessus subsp. abscessus]
MSDTHRMFSDRQDAGRVLAGMLAPRKLRSIVVLALPRGGIPVGREIATALNAPLAVLVVRKLGVPGHEEYAMGAIASGGEVVLDDDIVRSMGVTPIQLDEVTDRERRELARRERIYLAHRSVEIRDKTVIFGRRRHRDRRDDACGAADRQEGITCASGDGGPRGPTIGGRPVRFSRGRFCGGDVPVPVSSGGRCLPGLSPDLRPGSPGAAVSAGDPIAPLVQSGAYGGVCVYLR